MISKFKLGELILVKDGSVYSLELKYCKPHEGGILETKTGIDPACVQAPNIVNSFLDLGLQVERMLINDGTSSWSRINMEA